MKDSIAKVIDRLLYVKERYIERLEDSINDFIIAIESEKDVEIKSAFYRAKEKCYLSHLNIDGALKDTFESLGYKEEE